MFRHGSRNVYLAILSLIHFSLIPCSVNMWERRRVVMWLKRSPLTTGSTDLGTLPLLMNNLWSLEIPTGSISDCGWERNNINTHSPTNTTPIYTQRKYRTDENFCWTKKKKFRLPAQLPWHLSSTFHHVHVVKVTMHRLYVTDRIILSIGLFQIHPVEEQ